MLLSPEVLHACFSEIGKSAGVLSTVAEHAAGLGQGTVNLGRDIGQTALHTFNPVTWKKGVKTLGSKGLGEKAFVGGVTALDAGHTAMQDTDPVTGRHLGAAERAALTASHVGAGLASYHVAQGGILRSIAVGVPASMATDAVAHRVGGLVDRAGHAVAHPGGGSLPAKGAV